VGDRRDNYIVAASFETPDLIRYSYNFIMIMDEDQYSIMVMKRVTHKELRNLTGHVHEDHTWRSKRDSKGCSVVLAVSNARPQAKTTTLVTHLVAYQISRRNGTTSPSQRNIFVIGHRCLTHEEWQLASRARMPHSSTSGIGAPSSARTRRYGMHRS
jgi:hypothetical protein